MGRADRRFLKIAIERGYLDPEMGDVLLAECERDGLAAEEVLLERGILSRRRIERVHNHVRYRVMRKGDKAYAELACRSGVLTQEQAQAGLDEQRRRFEKDRERVRLGSLLVDAKVLTVACDRKLLNRLAGERPSALGVRSSANGRVSDAVARSGTGLRTLRGPRSSGGSVSPADRTAEVPARGDSSHGQSSLGGHSSAAMDVMEASLPGQNSLGPANYKEIDAAVQRVEEVRNLQCDMSQTGEVSRDSAAEFENACAMLARRRLEAAGIDPAPARPGRPRPPRKGAEGRTKPTGDGKVKKSGSILQLLGLGAA